MPAVLSLVADGVIRTLMVNATTTTNASAIICGPPTARVCRVRLSEILSIALATMP